MKNFPLTRFLRRFTATIFVLAGIFKLALLVFGLLSSARVPSFAALLATLNVPFPQLFAVGVPLLEIIGGGQLWRNRQPRLWAALLACDMSVAIALVGVPAKLGRAPKMGAMSIGGESWRLPLEIGLLALCLFLALRKEVE